MRRDQAYLAGHCLLVQRGTVPGELYYSVTQGEVYDIFTHKKVMYPGGAAMYWGGQAFSPPSAKWAVMMQEEEGILSGYYFLGQDCLITSHKFEEHLFNNPCGAGQGKSPSFGSDEYLVLSFREDEGAKCFMVVIRPDGSHEIEETPKK